MGGTYLLPFLTLQKSVGLSHKNMSPEQWLHLGGSVFLHIGLASVFMLESHTQNSFWFPPPDSLVRT